MMTKPKGLMDHLAATFNDQFNMTRRFVEERTAHDTTAVRLSVRNRVFPVGRAANMYITIGVYYGRQWQQ